MRVQTISYGGQKTTKIYRYKNRRVDPKRYVRVYRNLNKGPGRWYSIWQNGKIVGHTKAVMLRDAVFIVRESGRQRMLRTGRKNVHAYIEGSITATSFGAIPTDDFACAVHYDPWKHTTFMTDYGPIRYAGGVVLNQSGVTYTY